MGKDVNKIKQALDLLLSADPGLARKNLHAERLHPDADETAGADNDHWAVKDADGRTYKVGPLVMIAAWIAE